MTFSSSDHFKSWRFHQTFQRNSILGRDGSCFNLKQHQENKLAQKVHQTCSIVSHLNFNLIRIIIFNSIIVVRNSKIWMLSSPSSWECQIQQFQDFHKLGINFHRNFESFLKNLKLSLTRVVIIVLTGKLELNRNNFVYSWNLLLYRIIGFMLGNCNHL